jgi:hypothetical protein
MRIVYVVGCSFWKCGLIYAIPCCDEETRHVYSKRVNHSRADPSVDLVAATMCYKLSTVEHLTVEGSAQSVLTSFTVALSLLSTLLKHSYSWLDRMTWDRMLEMHIFGLMNRRLMRSVVLHRSRSRPLDLLYSRQIIFPGEVVSRRWAELQVSMTEMLLCMRRHVAKSSSQ